jgi:hypothetical protein
MSEKKKSATPKKGKEPQVEQVPPEANQAQVPATTSTEVVQRAGEDIPVHRVTTALIRQKWGNAASLDRQDAAVVARTIHESFPMFGPYQIINNFDVLAGKTLYMNANGYIDIAMSHPQTESPPLLRQIEHGSDDWATYMGDVSPDVIAAAYVCEFKRRDREIPFVEANYCPMDDDLLYKGKRNSPDRKKKDDWRPLAMKIARTRAIRRCLRFAFSPTEAAALYAEKKVEAVLEKAQRRELPKPVASPADPYTEEQPVREVGPEPGDFDPDRVAIAEHERRKLFAITERLDTGDLSPMEAIKYTLADLSQEQTGELVEIGDISTKKITYGMYPELISRLHERFPFKDREVVEVDAVVEPGEEQEQLPL